MRTFGIFVAVNVLGATGWRLGSPAGIGTAFALGAVASLAGVREGWHFSEKLLS